MADLADWGQREGKMATLWHGPCDIRNRTRQRRVERGKMPQWSGLQRPYKKRQKDAETLTSGSLELLTHLVSFLVKSME